MARASSEIDDYTAALEPAIEDASPRHSQGSALGSVWRLIRSAGFLAVLLGSIGIAAAGCGLVTFLFLTRSYTPPTAHLVKELYFDYSDSTAVAAAALTDAILPLPSQGGPARVFPSGQLMNVWLELEAAEPHDDVNTDMFQVLAQLRTAENKAAATASRPCLVPYRGVPWRWIRTWTAAPLVLLGLRSENELVRVPLFSRYREQAARPFVEFRAVLKAVQRDGNLPHLYSAKVHVELVLGLLGRLLYLVRPVGWATLLLLGCAVSMIIGGSISALITLVLWMYAGAPSKSRAASPAKSDLDAASDFGMKDEVEFAGFRSTSGEMKPRQKESAAEPEQGIAAEEILEEHKSGPAGLQKRRGAKAKWQEADKGS